MSDVVERAKARRAELMTEVARIDDLLNRHKSLAAEIAAALNGGIESQIKPSARKRTAPQDTGNRKRGPNGARPEEIAAAANAALREAGRPLTRFELIPLVEAQGCIIGGTDKARNLGTILWRSKQFESTGDGYWPLGVSRKEGGLDMTTYRVDAGGQTEAFREAAE